MPDEENSPDTPDESHLTACPSCASVIDVSEQEPWTRVLCAGCGTEMRVRTNFHHFAITGQIGAGGMSRVFGAEDQSLERDVALKILNRNCSRDGRRLRQFEKEAEITARISHPNVVKVYTASRDQGYFYIAMELVSAGSLDDLINDGAVPEDRVLEIAIACVEGLKAASSNGLIHRDIKPGNILFSEDGVPKIVDFGLAVFARDSGQGGEIWATPFYVPPETLHAQPEDFRSDIYALGATLYHALMGKPPFNKDTNSIEELKLMKAKPADLKEATAKLSVETVAMLERCLQRKPADRYASYDEFLDHLRFARRRLKSGGKGGIWPGRKPRGLTPAKRAAAIAAAAAILGAGAWLAGQNGVPAPQHGTNSLITDADPTTGTDSSTSTRFVAARDALFRNDYPNAIDLFSSLADAPATRQPTAAWARFNAGLAALFAGDMDRSHSSFAALARVSPWTDSPEDAALASFFQSAGGWLQSGEPVPVERQADCPGDSVRALGLLAAGVKNGNLGRFAESLTFLTAFENSTPPGSAQWLQAYKTLGRPWLEDARILAGLPPAPAEDSPLTLDDARTALQTARDSAAGLTTASAAGNAEAARVIDAFTRTVARLEDAAAAAEYASRRAGIRQQLATIHAANDDAAALAASLQFDAAAAKLRALTAADTEVKAYLRTQVTLWENAGTFLDLLGRDLQEPVETLVELLDAAPVRGRVTLSGTDLRIRPVKGPDATIPAAKVAPSTFVSLAESVLDRTADSDEYYRRRELLVAFALRSGLTTYADWSARELCRESRSFRALWTKMRTLEVEGLP